MEKFLNIIASIIALPFLLTFTILVAPFEIVIWALRRISKIEKQLERIKQEKNKFKKI